MACDDKTLEQARKHISSWFNYFADNIERARTDVEFALVNQWDKEARFRRERDKKPTLEFNQLYAHVTAIIGEYRKNTPNILVHPTSHQVKQEEVDLREGIIRQTFYESKSDVVFQEAFKWTMYGGFAALRVMTDYESADSFNQCIRITHVDPTKAFFDPRAQKPDKSDGRYCGVYERLSKKEFEAKYPDHSLPASGFSSDQSFDWHTDDSITIAEYFVKEYFTKRIAQLSIGQVMERKEAEQFIEESRILSEQGLLPTPITILTERDAEEFKIMHYKLTRDAILEKSEWPSKELPIIFVDGDSFTHDGQQITKSYIHYAKDAQRYLNYVASESAFAILNSRREGWIGTPENIQGKESMWMNPSRVQGILLATPDSKTGLLPQKLPPSEIPSTLITQYQRAMEDIKTILGRYEANMGMPGNERSGIAISNRVKQGNAATMVYLDNINRAIESCARVILGLIPMIMDGTRTLSIRSRENKQHLIEVNKPHADSYANDLSLSSFTVTVEAGPNYAIQKAEALQQLLQLASMNPQIAQVIPDLIGANLELENMPQIVERLKTLLPPAIQAQEEGKPLPPPEPNPHTLLEQQKLKIELMKAENEATRIQLEKYKLGLDVHVSHVKSQAEMGKAKLAYDTALLNHKPPGLVIPDKHSPPHL